MYVTRLSNRPDADPIHNYYEDLVIEALNAKMSIEDINDEEFSDIVCLALNYLPPKYIRHEVDLIYFSNEGETHEMRKFAKHAVQKATRVVKLNTR